MSKKALLMILDGWGLGDQKKDDVIFNTPTWCRTCGLSGFGENQSCMCRQQHPSEPRNRFCFLLRKRKWKERSFHGIDF